MVNISQPTLEPSNPNRREAMNDKAKPALCSCKASARDGQHMSWCPAVSETAAPPDAAQPTEHKSEAEITNDLLQLLLNQIERLTKQNERLLGEIDSVNGNIKTFGRHSK